MQRTFRTIALVVALSAAAGSASAQDFVFGWNPRSGDVWVDQRLGDINQYGTRYRDPFIDDVSRYYGAPRDFVSDLIIRRRWAPGDVYYACSIAQIIGRPCRYVVDEWDRNHGQGWGALAQRLGIKPGSAEFHRLKKGFVPTYDRWSRPIVLDADLQRDFPNRGKGGSHQKSSHHDTGHGSDHGKGKSATAHGQSVDKGKPAQSGKSSGKGKPVDSGKSSGGGKPADKGGGKGNGKKG